MHSHTYEVAVKVKKGSRDIRLQVTDRPPFGPLSLLANRFVVYRQQHEKRRGSPQTIREMIRVWKSEKTDEFLWEMPDDIHESSGRPRRWSRSRDQKDKEMTRKNTVFFKGGSIKHTQTCHSRVIIYFYFYLPHSKQITLSIIHFAHCVIRLAHKN